MDKLQEAAKNYQKLIDTEYLYTLGTNDKTRVILEFIGCNTAEFTHILGLDHLQDVPALKNSKNSSAKNRIFKKICDGEITLEKNLAISKIIDNPIPMTYNPETQKEYTVRERILSLCKINDILDNVGKETLLYKWDPTKSKVMCPNGRTRKLTIQADFLLVTPGMIKGTNYYLFSHIEKNTYPDQPTRLKIHSAFVDGVDLTQGQGKSLPILQIDKYTDKRKNVKNLYKKPNYKADEVLYQNILHNHSSLKI